MLLFYFCFREGLLLGLGNPLLDILATVSTELLSKYSLKPNDAILADDSHRTLVTDMIKNYKVDYIAGGSVQNSLRIAQVSLGYRCSNCLQLLERHVKFCFRICKTIISYHFT